MIYAMFGMVMITLVIGIITVTVRIRSVKTGDVSIKYYRGMNGQEVPDFINRTSRSFNNMFEVPVLFYVVSTLFVSLGIESLVALILAWVFVGSRLIHAMIHLTYNNVLHRMLIFQVGVVTVIAMWIVLVVTIT